MYPIRHVIEDDAEIKEFFDSVASQGPVSETDLSVISGIICNQHDKLTEKMEAVEETMGKYVKECIGNARIAQVSVWMNTRSIIGDTQ